MKNKLIKLLGGYTKEDIWNFLGDIDQELRYNDIEIEQLQPIINNALELLDKKLLE